MIRLKSVHDPVGQDTAPRYMVDWKWPAHKHHSDLRLAGWPRQLLPDVALWNWFHHSPRERLSSFRWHYFRQLDISGKYWVPIACASELEGGVTLLHGSRSSQYVPAKFLKEYLELRLKLRSTLPVHSDVRGSHLNVASQGVMPPAGKSISRKDKLPLREKVLLQPKQRLGELPVSKRRFR